MSMGRWKTAQQRPLFLLADDLPQSAGPPFYVQLNRLLAAAGFDLISRRPHTEDPKTFIEVRFIEVKGRAGVGVVALSSNEYTTAQRLKQDYWLYVAFNCAGTPQLHAVQNPARLGWQPVMAVEHYQVGAGVVVSAAVTTPLEAKS